jgi:hypothetical protein
MGRARAQTLSNSESAESHGSSLATVSISYPGGPNCPGSGAAILVSSPRVRHPAAVRNSTQSNFVCRLLIGPSLQPNSTSVDLFSVKSVNSPRSQSRGSRRFSHSRDRERKISNGEADTSTQIPHLLSRGRIVPPVPSPSPSPNLNSPGRASLMAQFQSHTQGQSVEEVVRCQYPAHG